MDPTRPRQGIEYDHDSDESWDVLPAAGDDMERMAASSEYAESEPALVEEVDASEHEGAGEGDDADEPPAQANAKTQETQTNTEPAEQKAPDGHASTTNTKKRKRDAAAGPPQREPGKSIFPVSRVQKILKADKVRSIEML